MERKPELSGTKEMAAEIDAAMQVLPVRNSPNTKAVIHRHSQELETADPAFVVDLGREVTGTYGYRGVAFELILRHKEAFESLGAAELEELGRGGIMFERRIAATRAPVYCGCPRTVYGRMRDASE